MTRKEKKKQPVEEEPVEEGQNESSDADVEASAESDEMKEEEEEDAGENDASGSDTKEKKKKKKRRSSAEHPPTTDMVVEALMELSDKKGSSIQAIKNYIVVHNTVRSELLSRMLRLALPKLLEKETIMRPKGDETKSVLLGRYMIAPKALAKPPVRERPASLRRLKGGKVSKSSKKKKKRRRSGFY